MVRQHRTTISRSEDYTNNWYAAQDIEDIVKHMPPSEIAHILDECSDVSGEISKTCIDAMDAIFLQLPANTHIWPYDGQGGPTKRSVTIRWARPTS